MWKLKPHNNSNNNNKVKIQLSFLTSSSSGAQPSPQQQQQKVHQLRNDFDAFEKKYFERKQNFAFLFSPVWPDLAKFRHFGKILKVLGQFLE